MKVPFSILLCTLCSFTTLYGQNDFSFRLAEAAVELTSQTVVYDPGYYSMPYPNGDVPLGRGVCTDVVIRSYRKVGIDLQKEVHEDMLANFDKYPKLWGLSRPDTNIDHRRVPNLMRYFARHGSVKPVSLRAEDYAPGEIVFWNLGGGVMHVGIVSGKRSEDDGRYLMVHNIGGGQKLEDCLFRYEITGHYIYPALRGFATNE